MQRNRRGGQAKGATGPPAFHLPKEIYDLFAPRPEPEFKPPVKKRGKPTPLTGVGQFVELFETTDPPAKVIQETRVTRKARLLKEKSDRLAAHLKDEIRDWDPHKAAESNEKYTKNAFHTIIVARIPYQTTEAEVKRLFEKFGPIKSARMVHDKNDKPRGYMFIEYENEADMKQAYAQGDAMRIEDRRVLVDVERGRTMESWKPRRLGGGLGGLRKGAKHENDRFSGRENNQNRSIGRQPASHGADRVNRGGADRRGYSDRGGYGKFDNYSQGGGRRGGDSYRDRDRGYGGDRGSGNRGGDRYSDRDRNRRNRSRDRRGGNHGGFSGGGHSRGSRY